MLGVALMRVLASFFTKIMPKKVLSDGQKKNEIKYN